MTNKMINVMMSEEMINKLINIMDDNINECYENLSDIRGIDLTSYDAEIFLANRNSIKDSMEILGTLNAESLNDHIDEYREFFECEGDDTIQNSCKEGISNEISSLYDDLEELKNCRDDYAESELTDIEMSIKEKLQLILDLGFELGDLLINYNDTFDEQIIVNGKLMSIEDNNKNQLVFDSRIDSGLCEMEDEGEGKIYKKYKNGIKLSKLIYHKKTDYDDIDNRLIKALDDYNIDLKQPVIAHICNTCEFGDYRTVILCKDYYLAIGYYSAGANIASFSIYKWLDNETEFFDKDLNFKNMNKVIYITR